MMFKLDKKKLFHKITKFKYTTGPKIPDWIYIPKFYEFLYYRSRIVMMMIWLFALYHRFFTVPGRLILAATLFVAFYGMVLFLAPLLLLVITLASLFIVDFIFGFVFKPKVEIIRKIPDRVGAGSNVKIVYYLTNIRKLSALNLVFDPVHLKPGIKYLTQAASVDYVPPGGKEIVDTILVAERRGQYELPMPNACSAFPFGIFKWNCRIKTPQKLLVYPQYTPLDIFTLPTGKKYQRLGNNLVSKVGESMDILGCREFRVGDDPKHIHWPSTAKTGKLIVKEFQEEYLSRVAIILDSYVPPTARIKKLFYEDLYSPRLEAAISLTAAIADYLTKGDLILDIFVSGPDVYHFQSGRSLDNFDHLLDILACLQHNEINTVDALSPTIMEEISEIGTAIVILLKWDKNGEKIIQELNSNGVGIKTIIVTEEETEGPEQAVILKHQEITKGNVRSL